MISHVATQGQRLETLGFLEMKMVFAQLDINTVVSQYTVHVSCLRESPQVASLAVSVSKGQPWKTKIVTWGQLFVMATMPSSVTFRQWLTFSSLNALAHCPRERAIRPEVVTWKQE
jgi:hypothetical protein